MQNEDRIEQIKSLRVLLIIPFGIAINVAIGTVVSTLKIPLYFDAVATIVVTLLAGWRAGVAVGVGSFLVGGLLVNPVLPWFSGTQVAIALFSNFIASNGWLEVPEAGAVTSARVRMWLRICIAGATLGVIAGVISAPVIVWLFSGITGSGPSLIVAVFLKSGETLFNAVLYSGVASEPIDKALQLSIAVIVVRALPASLKTQFGGPYLIRNKLAAVPIVEEV